MDFFEEDIIRFLTCLNTNKVKYILVGGFAVNVNGINRATKDLDIWLIDSIDNRELFVKALKEYGIEGAEIFHTLPFIAGYTEIILDNGFAVDIMSDLQFFKKDKFQECFEMANMFTIHENIEIPVLHLNHLIREKEQSKRPKDIIDAEQLKKLYRS